LVNNKRMSTPFVIGVDGGGTHTRVCVAAMDGRILARHEAGSSAISVNGMPRAQHILEDAIAQAKLAAGLNDQDELRAICFGLSGVDRADEREPMMRWAASQFTARAEVVNDCGIVLEAGSASGWGVALIAGTGAIGFGKSPEGRRGRAGGWGYLVGDEGSAYDIAREGLRAALRAVDGRGEPTDLVSVIQSHLKVDRMSALVPVIYRHNTSDAGGSPIRPDQLAALAPLVTRTAEMGDGVAQGIVQRAGRELSLTVLAVARQLHLPQVNTPLALAGGLLLKSDIVRSHLMAALSNSEFTFAPVTHVAEPVHGAVRVALRLAHER
jgi:N-acetylglucosamine kinase-like BadF-type ATPase